MERGDNQVSCSLTGLILLTEPQQRGSTSSSLSMEWEGAGYWKLEAQNLERG